ncbi:MAG: type II toxin-antitoxin system RelE/ParE family toxin [Gemmatimonadales bacterium]
MPAFIVRPLAEADVQAAFDWYEEQAEGLGHEFLRALDASYASIARWPESYPVVYRGVRRALLRRFPYLVYYRSIPQAIEVLACVHGKQHPRKWRRRT